MKIQDFELFFLKTKFSFSVVLTKKPNVLLKQYVLRTRLKNYVCLNYLTFFSIMQQITFFLQKAALNKTPFVFFLEDAWLIPLYKELIWQCNEFLCHTPTAYSNIYGWSPYILDFKGAGYAFPKLTFSGVALGHINFEFKFFSALIGLGWPCVLATPITLQSVTMKHRSTMFGSGFFLPVSESVDIAESYFNMAFFSKILFVEKQRKLLI